MPIKRVWLPVQTGCPSWMNHGRLFVILSSVPVLLILSSAVQTGDFGFHPHLAEAGERKRITTTGKKNSNGARNISQTLGGGINSVDPKKRSSAFIIPSLLLLLSLVCEERDCVCMHVRCSASVAAADVIELCCRSLSLSLSCSLSLSSPISPPLSPDTVLLRL